MKTFTYVFSCRLLNTTTCSAANKINRSMDGIILSLIYQWFLQFVSLFFKEIIYHIYIRQLLKILQQSYFRDEKIFPFVFVKLCFFNHSQRNPLGVQGRVAAGFNGISFCESNMLGNITQRCI